jgi:hypothetical protein
MTPHDGIIFIINSLHLIYKLFPRNYGDSTCATNISSSLQQWKADPWPRGLTSGYTADGLFADPNTASAMDSVLSALSRKGVCVGLITRPKESHRAWCV